MTRVVCLLALLLLSGCNLLRMLPVGPGPSPGPGPVDPDPGPGPGPSPVNPRPAESVVWNALADVVGSGGVPHTDRLLRVAEILRDAKYLSDLSRLERWRPKREDITEANRAAVAAVVRGGPG